MDRIELNTSEYELFKSIDFEDLEKTIIYSDAEHSFEVDDADALLIVLNEHITMHGLTPDQESANEYGRRLYDLYDAIYEQL